ncbi:PAAR domain-containing protein [Actinokineospora sp. 24-640]
MSFAAKMGDKVVGTDTHVVMVPSPGGPVPTPTPLPFTGTITGGCSPDVFIGGAPAAVVGSTATNLPPHIVPPPSTFQVPPTNQGTVAKGSSTVLINNKPAARNGDTATTCNDPAPAPTGSIIATGTVMIGG